MDVSGIRRRAGSPRRRVVGLAGTPRIEGGGRVAAAPPRARNVVLIVWDTVRAYSVSGYGHPRNTTPNLTRWAQKGVQYNYALAPAPWTFPSHVSFFTGQWPLRTNTQWKMQARRTRSDPGRVPGLTGLPDRRASRRTPTAAPTRAGSTGDSPITRITRWRRLSILARTVPGQWILPKVLRLGGWYNLEKWVRLQSRDAGGINGSFLAWLGRRRLDRPFFAFLNYFDAHEPYVPPASFEGRFGIRPTGRPDHDFLLDYTAIGQGPRPVRDIDHGP